MHPTVGRAGNLHTGTIGPMKTDTLRAGTRPSRRILAGLFALALLLCACGNNGSPNSGGAGGIGAAKASEAVAPEVSRNLQ